jgi:Uma2 family endonuclease
MNVITPVAPLPDSPETITPQPPAPHRKRFTVEEYHRLIDLGFFAVGDRVELIYGDLVQMASKGKAHILCCRKLLQQLPDLAQGFGIVQCQDPIVLTLGSEPEPDFAILDPAVGEEKPTADQTLLVIEVSDSSLDYDRNTKGPLYAESQIPHYWIFNVIDRQVECYSQPQQTEQGKWGYGLQRIILPGQILALPNPLKGTIDLSQSF